MCGICGFISTKRITEQELKTMNNVMSHRGPDDAGILQWTAKDGYNIGFGHRRLSVIDLSIAGHQPMSCIDQEGHAILTVVFNGEIYNYTRLKNQLKDFMFKTNSDTEVILASYLKWGGQFLEHLQGMFSIALYDHRDERLILARDRIGKKPLYYYLNDDEIVFASELKAIMMYPGFEKMIDRTVLAGYLHYGCIRGEKSIFINTYKLRPGCFLEFVHGKYKIFQYWSSIQKYHDGGRITDSYEKIKIDTDYLINEAIKDRLAADVPVGTFLSGGIDSSLVTAVAQKQKSDPIKTFSIGFFEKEKDEAPFAKEIASYLGTDHTELYVGEKELFNMLEDLPKYYDEPFSDSSQIPSMLVAKLAREQVTVALTGDGGDEFFCGYPRYTHAHQAEFLEPLAKILRGPKGCWQNSGFYNKVPFRVKAILQNSNPCCQTQIGGENYIELANTLVKGERQEIKHMVEQEYGVNDWMTRNMLLDINFCLPDDYLTKVDRATMKYSLEARCPLLDVRLMEYALRIPTGIKYKKATLKYLLKDIAYDYIPRELLDRPKKGFEVPMEKWLKGSLKEKLLEYASSEFLKKQDLFSADRVTELIEYYLKNNDKGRLSGRNFTNLVWAFFVFQMWYQYFCG